MCVKRLIICSSLLFFLIFSIGSTVAGEKVSFKDSGKKDIVEGKLGKKLNEYLTRITPFGFSGVLLVVKDGKVILNKGYGLAIRSENIPNTSESVFSTGSITKQFTAAGIMKLEMQGKLNTDDRITKYFESVPEDKKGITLHHLLTHTAGVINYTGMDYVEAGRDETVRKILDGPLLFKPGERFEYSNAGYSMLAAIIEKVSRQSYEEFIHEQLFVPARMEFTGYRIPDWGKKVVAHWYVGDKDNGIPLGKPYPYWNLLGNGGILSTTEDMHKWHQALLGERILSAGAKKKIFTPFMNDYGYGWDVLETERGTLIQHDGGSMLGNSAEFRRYIDAGVVTMLFCNQSYGRGALFGPIRDKIERLVFGGDVITPPSVITLNTEKLLGFEGTYRLSSGDTLEVKVKSGGLTIRPDGQDAVNMLLFQKKAAPGFFQDLNKRSVLVFKAALKGDFKPFEKVLYNKEKRLEPVRRLIEMRIEQYKKRTGAIKDVLAVVTLPSDFRGEEGVLTYVQLKGEKGSIFFTFYWHNKKNIGLGPAMSVPDLSAPLMPLSETQFAGYRLDMARNIRLTFNVDEKGSVTGITVLSPSGDLSAKKI